MVNPLVRPYRVERMPTTASTVSTMRAQLRPARIFSTKNTSSARMSRPTTSPMTSPTVTAVSSWSDVNDELLSDALCRSSSRSANTIPRMAPRTPTTMLANQSFTEVSTSLGAGPACGTLVSPGIGPRPSGWPG